jgi:hypothetical protein
MLMVLQVYGVSALHGQHPSNYSVQLHITAATGTMSTNLLASHDYGSNSLKELAAVP